MCESIQVAVSWLFMSRFAFGKSTKLARRDHMNSLAVLSCDHGPIIGNQLISKSALMNT